MSEQPATSAGTPRAAGDGVGDQELESQGAEQTDGAATDTEIAKASGDDLA